MTTRVKHLESATRQLEGLHLLALETGVRGEPERRQASSPNNYKLTVLCDDDRVFAAGLFVCCLL